MYEPQLDKNSFINLNDNKQSSATPQSFLCILYHEETRKALENFKITEQPFFKGLAKNIAAVKMAAAFTNEQIGNLNNFISKAITKAAYEMIDGQFDDQLVVDQIQGGAGTSINMNVNEVLATRATLILNAETHVHPIDHVNMAQSTNDVVPTAMKITTLQLLDELIETYGLFYEETKKKSEEFKHILKVGRTHLQDAVPITLGQQFGAHANMIKKDRQRLIDLKEKLYEINLGGTAVGTGLTASKKYIDLVVKVLSKITNYPLRTAEDLIYSTQYPDSFLEVSSILTVLAANNIKYMNDLRLLASGPYTGFSEIKFGERQKGSSIMPGKVNPVMAETLNQVCFQIIGNNQAVLMAVQAGQFELNVMLPVVAKNLFESLKILKNGIKQFVEYGLKMITANEDRCQELFFNSYAVATALSPKIGYDKMADVVKEVIKTKKCLKEVLYEKGIMNKEEFDEFVKDKGLIECD